MAYTFVNFIVKSEAKTVAPIKTIPPIVGVEAFSLCLSGAQLFMGCTLEVFVAHFIKIGIKTSVKKRAKKNEMPARIVM